jgi:hypothetical protein
LGKIGRVLAQQKPERHLSRAIGFRHRPDKSPTRHGFGGFARFLHNNGKIVIADR